MTRPADENVPPEGSMFEAGAKMRVGPDVDLRTVWQKQYQAWIVFACQKVFTDDYPQIPAVEDYH